MNFKENLECCVLFEKEGYAVSASEKVLGCFLCWEKVACVDLVAVIVESCSHQ